MLARYLINHYGIKCNESIRVQRVEALFLNFIELYVLSCTISVPLLLCQKNIFGLYIANVPTITLKY